MLSKLSGRAPRTSRVVALLSVSVCFVLGSAFQAQPPRQATPTAAVAPATLAAVGLVPTQHPPIPATWAETWLVPEPGSRPSDVAKVFAQGVRLYEAGSFASALASFDDPRLASTALAAYARYYSALACRQLQRPDEARTRLDAVRTLAGDSVLAERAALAAADLAEAAGDPARAAQFYDEVLRRLKPEEPDLALAGLVRTSLAVGDRQRADAAALRLYYEFPTSSWTSTAADLVAAARQQADAARAAEFFKRDLGRGERLFSARLWSDARLTFEGLRPRATGDDLELIDLRIAACDQHTGRHRAAADRLAPYLDAASRKAEARYFYLLALRGLGQADQFVARAWALDTDFPSSTWAADALNHLASFFLVRDRGDEALAVFARVMSGHPTSRHAERAAWKLGWSRYSEGAFAEAAEIFERGATNAPRSDYRPSWLYWAGRAREQAGDRTTAAVRYAVALTDYRNSYYGRLAGKALAALGVAPGAAGQYAGTPAPDASPGAPARPETAVVAATGGAPPNAPLVRALAGLELFALAEAEVRFAQRTWGASAALDATLAWIYSRQGELRRGIGLMRRTYPQFLTDAADRLPVDVLQVIFPLDYWPTIRRHAEARGLDPYLVAALVAQESTFQADARSVANAWGLMQIIPSTGRRLARAEGMRRFRTSQLVDPETNVRLGTRYFAGLLDRFGTEHFALAGYNAGESRVVRWRAERPDWAREEFIDDIPFPETQNYVKRILGTAEDYRRLYGERGAVPVAIARRATAAPASPGSMSESRPARNTSKAKPRSTSRSKAASQKKSSTRKTSSTPPATRKSL